ncbi:MAG: hypothetical protein HYY18_20375 [Planctomycetes bacterium]|nr:hypothetical protein [Planctomycetota bacterium]
MSRPREEDKRELKRERDSTLESSLGMILSHVEVIMIGAKDDDERLARFGKVTSDPKVQAACRAAIEAVPGTVPIRETDRRVWRSIAMDAIMDVLLGSRIESPSNLANTLRKQYVDAQGQYWMVFFAIDGGPSAEGTFSRELSSAQSTILIGHMPKEGTRRESFVADMTGALEFSVPEWAFPPPNVSFISFFSRGVEEFATDDALSTYRDVHVAARLAAHSCRIKQSAVSAGTTRAIVLPPHLDFQPETRHDSQFQQLCWLVPCGADNEAIDVFQGPAEWRRELLLNLALPDIAAFSSSADALQRYRSILHLLESCPEDGPDYWRENGEFISRMARSIRTFGKGLHSSDMNRRVLGAVTALEMLVTNSATELSEAFRFVGSLLHSDTPGTRINTLEDLRHIYSRRSKYVHSGIEFVGSKSAQKDLSAFQTLEDVLSLAYARLLPLCEMQLADSDYFDGIARLKCGVPWAEIQWRNAIG